MNTQIRRVLSMLLVLMMIVGMLPVSAQAAESGAAVDAAIIFSDLHTSSSDYKESTVKGIMTAFKNAGLPVSSVTSGGDAFSVNADSTKYTGDPTKLTGYIQNVLGNVPVNYVWSDHDRYGTGIDKKSSLVYGAGADGVYGTADDGNYYIYSLSMGDLCTYDRYNAGFNYTASSNNRASKGFTATVPEAIENFKAAAATLSKDRPLLIVSHQPLFDNRNDNGWAEDWCDAINEVAAEMDVAFFYGHNHKYDTGSDYYYAKGSTMPVATRKLTNGKDWNYDYQTNSGWQYNNDLASVNKVLNFTHLCAGYLAPSSTGSTSNTTREGTALAVTIYEDSIRFTTYNSKGIYTGSYAVDKTITRDFAVSEPELLVSGTDSYFVGDQLDLTVHYKANGKTQDVTAKASLTGYDMNTVGKQTVQISYEGLTAQFQIAVWQKVFTDAATGVQVEVSTPGATALTVNTLGAGSAAYEAAFGLLSSRVGYDLTLAGHVDGNQTIVTMPVPAGVTKPAVYNISDDGKTIARMNVTASANGSAVSFATDHFGNFIIGQEQITEDLESGLVAGGSSYADQTVYVRVDAFEDGGKYLIIGEDNVSDANPIAYVNNNGSEGSCIVTIQSGAVIAGSVTYSDGYIQLNNSGAVWTASGDASKGFTLSNNGKYIGGSDANTLKGSSGEAVKVIYDASAVRLKTASGTTRYLYYSTYSGENWKWATSIDSSTSSRKMWIYKEVTVQVPTSTQVTYTVQAEDLTHVLSTMTVQLQYALLANGAATELPAGAVFHFEVQNDENGIIKAISDDGVITFNRAEGTCYVKISCTWDAGTAYKYVKVTAALDPNACDHSYEAVVTAPTCTEGGYTTYTCTACGDSYVSDEVDALGHDYDAVVTAPTCTEGGYTTYTCTICGDAYTADETDALGHDYDVTTVAATCLEDGSITYTCACGHSYTEVIPATGHDYASAVTAPTCTEAGYTTYTCACGDAYVADEVAALGHSYETVTVNATCTEAGSVTYTCHCGHSYAESISALGHDYVSVVTAPTCTADGYTTNTCAACGHSYVSDQVAALGHDYDTVIVAPTCTEGGYTAWTCRVCGEGDVYDQTDALGHDYVTVTVEATCTIDGYTTHTCTRCDDSYVTDLVDALGHNYETVTVEATCTEDGSMTYTCHCGDVYTEVIPANGHSHTAVVTAPTCTEAGYTTYTCACGDTYVADEVDALGHDYHCEATDKELIYTCTRCGDQYQETLVKTYTQVDAFADGETHVIVLSTGKKFFALSHADQKVSLVEVTMSGNEITSEITADMLWTYQDQKLFYTEEDTTYYLLAEGSGPRAAVKVHTAQSSVVSLEKNGLKVGKDFLRCTGNKLKVEPKASSAFLFLQE